MSEHHRHDRPAPRVATITVSDTRTAATDTGGDTLRAQLALAGATLLAHALLADEPEALRAAVRHAIEALGADAVVLTGGTGIAPRDQTIEAVEPLFDKRLDGFGEAFRRLSWEQVGARSVLSRATAGTVGRALVVALPGSPRAVELAVSQLLGPLLPHAVGLLAT